MTSDLRTYSSLRQPYLEGHGVLVSGLISRILTRVTIWVIGVLYLLNQSPNVSSPHSQGFQG